MTDGTNPPDAELKYIFTTTGACQGNLCRAELASGHQCKNGDTVACTLTDSGLNGNSTCANGAWGACQ